MNFVTNSSSACLFALCMLLTGCAGPTYTVDDGSAVDEKFLSSIRWYGNGQQAVRPSIVKTAQLNDADCSKQWELPFAVASSYDLPHQDKIAWVRGAGVDERLSVIAVANGIGLAVGDKIAKIDGYHSENTIKMMARVTQLREDGDPFDLITSAGKTVKITPLRICRGYFNLAAPAKPDAQDYHWLQSTHPLSIFSQNLTPEEALWAVLWTQGLSEEVGMRMKTYHYTMKLAKTAITVASIASGVGAVATAAQAAAANIATTQATTAVANFAAQQAASLLRDQAMAAGKKIIGSTVQGMALDSLHDAELFRKSLSGISWVAGTGFYMADKWAFDRMAKLGADPIAAFTLDFKLASHFLTSNSFVFDQERLKLMTAFAQAAGLGEQARLAGGAPAKTEGKGNAPETTLALAAGIPATSDSKENSTKITRDVEGEVAVEVFSVNTPYDDMAIRDTASLADALPPVLAEALRTRSETAIILATAVAALTATPAPEVVPTEAAKSALLDSNR